VISRAAVEAVTSPENMAEQGDRLTGLQPVRDGDVVAELRRLEGLGAVEARRLGREAVAHVGGYIETAGGPGSHRLIGRLRRQERWWVPTTSVRRTGS
jgi:hypothetical protein